MPKLSVAIVGAGLGGLAFALALQKYAPDVEFEVYEGASELAEIGAGIGIQARPWTIMRALDLEADMLKIAGDGQRSTITVVYRKADQAESVSFSEIKPDDINFTFHRGEVQKVFLDNLHPTHKVHVGKRLVSYEQSPSGPITLRFYDDTTATCDVLVGADGLRSAVRRQMYTQLADAAREAGNADEAAALQSHVLPVFSGSVIYRTVIPKDSLPQGVATHPAFDRPEIGMYCGKGRHLVTYPISQGRALNVAAVIHAPEQEGSTYPGPWTSSVDREELVKEFVGWDANVQEIMKHVRGALKWAINVVTDLPTFVEGHVALLGDAAHGMTPHQGAGAGQGFEDAFLLAQLLGHKEVSKDNLSVALQVYDEVRRPLAQKVAALSRESGQLHQLASPELAHLTAEESATGQALTVEQLRAIGETIEQLKDWRAKPVLLQENEASMRRLEEAVREHRGRVRV